MSWRIRIVYKQPSEKESGWSFSMVNNAVDLPTAQTRANKLASLLLGLTGAQTEIKYIRINNTALTRQAITYKWAGTSSTSSKNDLVIDSDTPQTALLWSMRSADLTLKTSQAIRGIPDAWTTTGGLFTGGTGKGTAVNALMTELTNAPNGWVIRNLDPKRPSQSITSITAAGVVTCAAPLAIPASPGNIVILGRVRGMPTSSRKYRALNPAGNTFQLFPWPPDASAPEISGVSTASVAQYVESAIGWVEADTGTTHKVGRPFKVATGRRMMKKL
jgi:hypothetical protein